MKKFVLCILLILMAACNPVRNIDHSDISNTVNTELSTKMYLSMDRVLGISQVDSMIRADNLTNLDKWHRTTVKNEDRRVITTYTYIKSLEKKNMLIYTAIQYDSDTLYKCAKKNTEKTE